ncbi:MAG: type IV pilus twitching motility protein PilT, partial [Polyangiales bacterium]
VGGAWQALEEVPLTSDDILVLLTGVGGDRHVENLSEATSTWSFRSKGIGVITVSATRRGEEVRARFVVTKRDEKPAPVEPKRTSVRPKKSIAPSHKSSAPKRPKSERALKAIVEAQTPAVIEEAWRPMRLDEIIAAARASQASDVHVIAERPVLFRVAGVLTPRGEILSPEDVDKLISPVIPERLREPFARDGSVDFALDSPETGRARVNVARQRTGMFACFRLISAGVPSLDALGLPPEIGKATHHHQGLIVVTGPTGHGKTTTLAAIVDLINREHTHHVLTIEDPVEYIHPRKKAQLSQREVGSHTKSFRNALKAALREDPDVIVVGELRDLETVEMAISASETGHLVLGTMNTPSAAKTIDRLIDLFPPGDQDQIRITLAGGLKLVVGQRLVPSVDRTRMHVAVELLTGTVALWNLIRDKKTYQIPSLQQRGKALGILRLDDSLAELVRGGKITREDALAVAESPDTLAALLGGGPRPPSAPEPQKPAENLFQRAGAIFGRKP